MRPAPKKGDVITAEFLEELADARDKIAKLAKGVGMAGLSTSNISGATGVPATQIAVVQMLRDAYLPDDVRFADPTYDPEGEENATEIEYDIGEGDFVDLENRKMLVVAVPGAEPKEGDNLWVRYSERSQVWVPLWPMQQVVSAVMVTDFPVSGQAPGLLYVYDIASVSWVSQGSVWVREFNNYGLEPGIRYPAFRVGSTGPDDFDLWEAIAINVLAAPIDLNGNGLGTPQARPLVLWTSGTIGLAGLYDAKVNINEQFINVWVLNEAGAFVINTSDDFFDHLAVRTADLPRTFMSYVCIQANTGHEPSTDQSLFPAVLNYWRTLGCPVDGGLPGEGYDPLKSYATGAVVLSAGTYYIALGDPAVGDVPPSARWLALPGALNDLGQWDAGTAYAVGDLVFADGRPLWLMRHEKTTPMSGVGPPDPNSGSPSNPIYLDVADPTNPLLYYWS